MNDYNELIESLRSMEPMVCSTAAQVRFEESELFPVCEASLHSELLDAVAPFAIGEPR